jgi:hypothetical protein
MYRILKSTMSAALIFLLMVSFVFPSQAAEPAMNDLGVLFDKVEEMEQSEREALSKELSDLFHAYPFGFIRELNLESTELQDSVRLMLAEYNTSEEGNADYLQFLLSLYPEVGEQLQSHELNTYLTILLAFSPDVRNAGDDFTETLFTAMRYADGVGADQCGTILLQLFQYSPHETLRQLALEDDEFRQMAVVQLGYSCWGNEAEFKQNLENLANDDSLTRAEQDLLSALAAKLGENEETVPPETMEATTATESVAATEPSVPGTPARDDLWPAEAIITVSVVMAAVTVCCVVYFGKKKNR